MLQGCHGQDAAVRWEVQGVVRLEEVEVTPLYTLNFRDYILGSLRPVQPYKAHVGVATDPPQMIGSAATKVKDSILIAKMCCNDPVYNLAMNLIIKIGHKWADNALPPAQEFMLAVVAWDKPPALKGLRPPRLPL